MRKNRLLPENILSGKVRDEYIKAKGEIVKNKYRDILESVKRKKVKSLLNSTLFVS